MIPFVRQIFYFYAMEWPDHNGLDFLVVKLQVVHYEGKVWEVCVFIVVFTGRLLFLLGIFALTLPVLCI